MTQVYLLVCVYGALLSALQLSEALNRDWEAPRRLRRKLSRDRHSLSVFICSGLSLSLLLLLFPFEPGPMLVGDLFFALWLSYSTASLSLRYSGRVQQGLRWLRCSGYISSVLTVLHFLFPSLLLI